MKSTIKKCTIIITLTVMVAMLCCITKLKSSANSQLNLSQKQMLLLSIYSYELNSDKLQPISDNLNSMKKNGEFDKSLIKSVESGIPPSEFIKVFKEIEADKTLSNLVAVDSIETHIRATCFVPKAQVGKKGAEAVLVFLGTKGTKAAWLDDFEGAYNEDTNMQLEAKEFHEKISQNYTITNVTGHSKGGNLTQYITITNGDKIRNAISFDGQGFSDLFFNKYKTNIEKNASKLTNISSFNDPVHVLMYKLPIKEVIVKTDENVNPVLSHLPYHLYNIDFFDANGNYKKVYQTTESDIVNTVEVANHKILETCHDKILEIGSEKVASRIAYFVPLGQKILEHEDMSLIEAFFEEFMDYNLNTVTNYTYEEEFNNIYEEK